ncbi:MAG: hypothetical protein AB1730_12075 [Myxococcota bacterium]|jgi:hypothetical protein
MGKLLAVILGLTVLGFIGYKTMYGRMPAGGGEAEAEAPAQRLQGAKDAAKRIEEQQERQLEKADIPSD